MTRRRGKARQEGVTTVKNGDAAKKPTLQVGPVSSYTVTLILLVHRLIWYTHLITHHHPHTFWLTRPFTLCVE